MEKQILYTRLRYFKRPDEQSMRQFFEYDAEVAELLSTPDVNFFQTFSRFGKDFSGIPIVQHEITPETIDQLHQMASEIPAQECHNYGLRLFRNGHECHETRLWWGYADFFLDGEYSGMLCHSFLTQEYFGKTYVWDPMLMKSEIEGGGMDIKNHYGIPLPLKYLDWAEPHAARASTNFSGFLKEKVFRSQKLTERLWKAIETSKAVP
jgi:hypothetical protein